VRVNVLPGDLHAMNFSGVENVKITFSPLPPKSNYIKNLRAGDLYFGFSYLNPAWW